MLGSVLERGLSQAAARLDEVVAKAISTHRVDLQGLAGSASSLFISRLLSKDKTPLVIVVADNEAARHVASDLRFFLGENEESANVLVYPASDSTPFVEVAPDRRTSMDRLGTLHHLAQGLPWRALVVSGPAFLRRVPPRAPLLSRSTIIRVEEAIDRNELQTLLSEAGYLRVPVVEDAGTFAMRGALIDIFPPNARQPSRIELDDYLVMSIKVFDADDQRTIREVRELAVPPVREALLGPNEIARAREIVKAQCENLDWPTSKTRALVEEVESGRALFGAEGLLPAYYDALESLFDYLPKLNRTVLIDPTEVVRAMKEESRRAFVDRDAKKSEKGLVFPLESHYLDEEICANHWQQCPHVLVHRLAVMGAPTEDEASPLHAFESVVEDASVSMGGEDQSGLIMELKLQRARSGRNEALLPLTLRTKNWLEEGLRVFFSAHTTTQAERLISLLRGYGVDVSAKPVPDFASIANARASGRVEVVLGAIGAGFVLASEALVCVTEEEIFGGRSSRTAEAKKKRRKSKVEPFLEDLRQLEVGDYIVHVDHGIGRYLGLERKIMPRSKMDEMRGVPPLSVEVLIVEYSGGDKLFLPVTRLNQIQKFRGQEGAAPRIDKLGGQTFTKTKQRVERAVRQMADELLKLYAEREAATRPPLPKADRTYAEFEATFPFDETADQARAIEEVLSDLEAKTPMDRIVCGDVGFGKTEVAMRAAFRVALAGRQVAVLCPTTVLAQQHFHTFRDRMRDYPLRIETLSRFVEKKDQEKTLADLKEGKVDILIGTHRLLSKDIHFRNLGLLVVDEEQRFGVTHKERIKKLKNDVDVLTLSATPIPRTLQLAVGGLRDLSLITTPPTDRRAIRTLVTRWDDHLLKEAIQREITRGGQVFFVYNRIEGLYERANKLQALMPTLKLAVAHGQMADGQLETVMTDFVEGRYDMLCATAIIESGLDISRANTILIDRADTFGLAQLYQLRGRVGRSKERAYCYLISPPPSAMTDEARARIEALERFTELGSGFHVASLDMELRGAGDLLGAEQSGNIAAVGLDMFVHMLEDAVSHMRGEPVVHDVDPELTLDVEHLLPDEYIDDVGVRLSLYKRLASAMDDEEVQEIASEMEDRFGPPPPPAMQFVRAMALKPALRAFRVLGCEAVGERVTLHLREDTTLDPAKIMKLVAMPQSLWKLSPDMKLTKRFPSGEHTDAIERVRSMLRSLELAQKDAQG